MNNNSIVQQPIMISPAQNRILNLVRGYFGSLFEQASGQFLQNPSADNWVELRQAMVQWQFFQKLAPQEQIDLAQDMHDNHSMGVWSHLVMAKVNAERMRLKMSAFDAQD